MTKTMTKPTTVEHLQDLNAAQEALTFKLARGEDLTEADHHLVSYLGWDLRDWTRDESRKEIGRAKVVLENIPKAATAAEREEAKRVAETAEAELRKHRSDIEATIAREKAKLAALESAANKTAAVVVAQEQAVSVLRAKVPPIIRQRYDRTNAETSRKYAAGLITQEERDAARAEAEALLDFYVK